MTENKRFILTEKGITDTKTKKQYNKISSKEHICDSMSFSNIIDICKLLNHWAEENEELKKNCKNYAWYNKCKDLENENDLLKKELKALTEEYIAFSEDKEQRLKELFRGCVND